MAEVALVFRFSRSEILSLTMQEMAFWHSQAVRLAPMLRGGL